MLRPKCPYRAKRNPPSKSRAKVSLYSGSLNTTTPHSSSWSSTKRICFFCLLKFTIGLSSPVLACFFKDTPLPFEVKKISQKSGAFRAEPATKPVGRSGKMHMPEPAKCPTSNALHSGAVIAFAACKCNIGKTKKPSERLTHLTAATRLFSCASPSFAGRLSTGQHSTSELLRRISLGHFGTLSHSKTLGRLGAMLSA